MVEIELIEFEDFYKERLNTQFFKVKRAIKKIIEDLRTSLIDIKLCINYMFLVKMCGNNS